MILFSGFIRGRISWWAFLLIVMAVFLPSGIVAQAVQDEDPDSNPSLTIYASLNNYFFQDNYIFNPIVTADRGGLHLEGRYNYEDLHTLSLFAGYTMRVGNALRWDVTPMIGFAFGATSGFIPALEFTLTYGAFEWYNESEYVLITDEGDENYFYAWSELNYYPLDWLSVGLIVTRTRLYETDLEVQSGLSLGYYHGAFSLLGSMMNFGYGDPYVYLRASVVFD